MLVIFKHTFHHLKGLKSERLIKKALAPAFILPPDTRSELPKGVSTTPTSASAKDYQVLSKNLSLYPHSLPSELKANPQARPLCVLLNWLLASRKHVMKYGDLYRGQGFDVLNVTLTPWQLLWPVSGAQVVAEEVLTFLLDRAEYRSIVVHGFSVGGYLYGEMLVKMTDDPRKYDRLTAKIAGQVFDSYVDWPNMPVGVAMTLANNPLARKYLRMYLSCHMRVFHFRLTRHLQRSSRAIHRAPLRCPSLVFFSLDDPFGTARANYGAVRAWREKGAEVFVKCWDASQHVAHLRHHPREYVRELTAFLDRIHHLARPLDRHQEDNKI